MDKLVKVQALRWAIEAAEDVENEELARAEEGVDDPVLALASRRVMALKEVLRELKQGDENVEDAAAE